MRLLRQGLAPSGGNWAHTDWMTCLKVTQPSESSSLVLALKLGPSPHPFCHPFFRWLNAFFFNWLSFRGWQCFWSYLQSLKELVAIRWGPKFQGTKTVSAPSKSVAHSQWPLEGSRKPGTNMVLSALSSALSSCLRSELQSEWDIRERAKLME